MCLPIAGGKEGDKFTTMEAKNWWFVDVSPSPRGYVQVPAFSFQGIYMTMGSQNRVPKKTQVWSYDVLTSSYFEGL